jgi:dTDP-4-dehydrorhamnose 3,5-epimerase-like enzyme
MEAKVWGKKDTIFKENNVAVDILYLKKNTFCSWHYHSTKYNKFVVQSGRIRIEIIDPSMPKGYGVELDKDSGYDYVIVNPKKEHRFVVLEDSVVIEIMYTDKDNPLYDDDIVRSKQGGKIVDGKEIRECDLGGDTKC